MEGLRKQLIKIFKDCELNITIKMNLKTVDFLDVRFDLVNNTYQPSVKQTINQFISINNQIINPTF